jgi:hypothetical protein
MHESQLDGGMLLGGLRLGAAMGHLPTYYVVSTYPSWHQVGWARWVGSAGWLGVRTM